MVFDNNYSTKTDNENTTISKKDTRKLEKLYKSRRNFFLRNEISQIFPIDFNVWVSADSYTKNYHRIKGIDFLQEYKTTGGYKNFFSLIFGIAAGVIYLLDFELLYSLAIFMFFSLFMIIGYKSGVTTAFARFVLWAIGTPIIAWTIIIFYNEMLVDFNDLISGFKLVINTIWFKGDIFTAGGAVIQGIFYGMINALLAVIVLFVPVVVLNMLLNMLLNGEKGNDESLHILGLIAITVVALTILNAIGKKNITASLSIFFAIITIVFIFSNIRKKIN